MSDQVQYPIKIHRADGAIEESTVATFTELQKSINSDHLKTVSTLSTADSQGKVYLVDEEILFRSKDLVPVNISELAQTTLAEPVYGDIIEITFDDMEAMPYSN